MKPLVSFIKIVFLLSLPILVSSTDISRSSAYFTSSAENSSGYTVSTGDWMPPPSPTLISPTNNSFRNTSGMVMDWTDVHDDRNLHDPVYYIYQSSHDSSFTTLAYQSGKLTISNIPAPGTPDGVYYWRVKACDSLDLCSNWSTVWKVTVDNISPAVLINSPTTSPVSGTVSIFGTVTDVNPDHYWLVITNSSGATVAGPGTVSQTASFTNKKLLTWDTTTVPDGYYTIKLEARDKADNKTPNLAPVPTDPEIIGDSVDWVTVYVSNDKVPPVTLINPGQPSLQTNFNFPIGYSASDTNFDYVELCYSYNSAPYVCGYHQHPLTGSFSFDSPRGDGLYNFYTIGHDLAGNVETVKSFPELTVQVDTIAPTTNLDHGSISTPHTTGQNLLSNGNFESGATGWTTAGNGDHQVVADGANHIFVLGNKDTDAGDVTDSLFRTFVLPQKLSSSLSFSYRTVSQDTVDNDQFRVEIRSPADVILESILTTGNLEIGGNNFIVDSGWRSLNHSLVDYAGQTIKVWFGQVNTDVGTTAKSWTYLDDICVNTLDLRVGETAPLALDTHDTGSGLATTEPSIAVNVGDTTITYNNTDIAGNPEATQSASMVVLPPVVLNKINSDNSVEIYNNSADTVDLTGYKINTLDIGPTLISAHTALTINGVGVSQTYVLNNGTTEVDVSPVIAVGENWQRTPVGIGTWNKIAATLDFNLVSRPTVNKITLSVFNIGAGDTGLDYEIKYTNSVGEQGFGGTITPETIVDGKTDRDFFLGTCSTGGACTPETVSVGSTISVTLRGTTKYFKY